MKRLASIICLIGLAALADGVVVSTTTETSTTTVSREVRNIHFHFEPTDADPSVILEYETVTRAASAGVTNIVSRVPLRVSTLTWGEATNQVPALITLRQQFAPVLQDVLGEP